MIEFYVQDGGIAEDQTLRVMSGSASTNLPLSGSGESSGISLEGRGMKPSGSGMRVSGSGHCSGGGKQGSGKFQQLVKKHKGDMKAASREYKQQKGSGLYPKFVEDGMDSLNKAGKDFFGSGQPLAVEQFLDEGASDEQDGSGKAADTLSKLSKGSAALGLALAPTGVK